VVGLGLKTPERKKATWQKERKVSGDLIVGTCHLEDACQPTNIVKSFYPHWISLRVVNHKGEAFLCDPQREFWPDINFLPWDSHLFKMVSNDVGAARRQKMRCWKWIKLVVFIYICTEPVPQSKHFARSVVPAPCFAATTGHYLKNIWNPKDIFFEKSYGQNPPLGPKGQPWIRNALKPGWQRTRTVFLGHTWLIGCSPLAWSSD